MTFHGLTSEQLSHYSVKAFFADQKLQAVAAGHGDAQGTHCLMKEEGMNPDTDALTSCSKWSGRYHKLEEEVA